MTHQHHKPRLLLAVRLLTATPFCIAALALLGYVAHKSRLIALTSTWQGMSMLTATGVIFLALAAGARNMRRRDPFAIALPLLTAVIMLAVLASHAVYRADILSPWLAESLAGLPAASSGLVSIATAACLLMLSVVFLARFLNTKLATAAAELASNAALLVAGTALLGYLYRVSDLYGLYVFNTMSLQSALSIVCLALAGLIGEPTTRLGMALRSPSLGVRHLRRMLVLPMLPIALGWILLRLNGPFASGNGAAMAMLVIATGVPMFYLLLENARAIELLDRERAAQTDIERRLTSDLQIRLDEQTAVLAASHSREVASLAHTERAKRFEMMAQLTGSIAHDFNNLLMVIGGSAQLLKLRMRGETGLLPLVEKISATVTGAAKLTGQLSAFSRTQHLQTASVNVDSVVRAALAENQAATLPGVRVVVEFDAGVSNVLSDSAQLQLAISHIIRNGLDAIGEHGSLHISTSVRPIHDGDNHAVIRISDSGCGMTPEENARATEPFFTTKRGNHHGLGLAQVASVVQQASGVLHITSQPGRGTTVELILPCVQANAETIPSLMKRDVPLPGNQRLLLIDDDDEVRTILAALLQQMDYDVVEARDGETGLRLLGECKPALAIIDFLMPGMNGAEVARRARTLSPHLSIIFISGYSDSKAISEIPYSRLLRKPVVAEELARTITDVLQSA